MALPAPGNLDWEKTGGLIPAIVQHADNGAVLMLGYMNAAALAATCESGRVTFFSRSKQRLWEKGETSGNSLTATEIAIDCDRDTLLVKARPAGPVCHRGTPACFDSAPPAAGFLAELERVIAARLEESDPESSYTARLAAAGPARMAQKVGEEGVEVALAGATGNREALIAETADLFYHTLVLLCGTGVTLAEVSAELARRHSA